MLNQGVSETNCCLTLIWVPLCWFSLNNLEMVKAITPAFRSIQIWLSLQTMEKTQNWVFAISQVPDFWSTPYKRK